MQMQPSITRSESMKASPNRHFVRRRAVRQRMDLTRKRAGKVKYALAAWLLGLPLPIILLALVFRGCDF
jgi:hypothetical protein